ncbi:MAG TPA: GNAT family N-acetyltransferase [Pirellulales bacterium]|nr:GNAT family N-acetyltransferase [Pirellulales bacterium]
MLSICEPPRHSTALQGRESEAPSPKSDLHSASGGHLLPPVIECSTFRLRPWQFSDKPALLRYANNRQIWRNLRDAFPHPYASVDADRWLEVVAADPQPEATYAIEIAGEAAGALSLERRCDIERHSAEIGYWLQFAHSEIIMVGLASLVPPYVNGTETAHAALNASHRRRRREVTAGVARLRD